MRVAGLAVLCAVALVSAGCSATVPHHSAQTPSGTSGVDTIGVTLFPAAQRKPLPNLSAATLAGPRLALESITRKGILVLNVWASWCDPCQQESPALATLAAELHGQGVSFVGIDERDRAASARSFLHGAGVTYPQLIDGSGTLLDHLLLLPADGIPSTLVMDQDGLMAARVIGPTTVAQLTSVISAVRAQQTPAPH